jgi:hypothetical protein
VVENGVIGLQLIECNATFACAVTMTIEAVLGEDGTDSFLKMSDGGRFSGPGGRKSAENGKSRA